MADTGVLTSDNGADPPVDSRLSLPDSIRLSTADMSRVPSPGTQRALKAETGKSFDDLVGPDADGADRFQTFIWAKLRRSTPGLRWADCAEIEIQIDENAIPTVDPTERVASTSSPASVGSGG